MPKTHTFPMTNLFLTIPNSWTAELMAHAGFDSLTLDMQHGLIDFTTAISMLQAISGSGVIPLVRARWNSPDHLMQVLDAGAQGIICPMIRDVRDVEDFLSACHYPPQGIRSFGPIRAQLLSEADYFNAANDSILKFAMIERKEAYENLEAIAAVPGLTGLYVGPFDLSVSMGIKEKGNLKDPRMLDILEQVLSACRKNNLKAGVFSVNPEDAREMQRLGFDLVSCGSDTRILSLGAAALAEDMKV